LSERDIEVVLHILDKSAYTDIVAKIAGQFTFDPSVVASILLDYKTWKFAEGEGSRTSSD
jgi:hypothetical protein